MDKRWVVQVTAEDIAAGSRFQPSECPVALAVKRAVGRKCHVDVVAPMVSIDFPDGGGSYHWLGSARMREWVTQFDAGYGVEPTRFALTIPKINERQQ